MPRSRRNWKHHEQLFAEALGTHRIPLMGREGSDFETEQFRVEHKVRPAIPVYLKEAWDQLTSVESDKVPLVALTVSKQGVKAERYVMLRLEDFIRMLNEPSP